jgi:hypothetical protein
MSVRTGRRAKNSQNQIVICQTDLFGRKIFGCESGRLLPGRNDHEPGSPVSNGVVEARVNSGDERIEFLQRSNRKGRVEMGKVTDEKQGRKLFRRSRCSKNSTRGKEQHLRSIGRTLAAQMGS